MTDMTLQVLAYIAAVGAALAALTKWVILPIATFVRRIVQFLEDWFGEPARPGFEERPGVMQRLANVEHSSQRAEFHLGNGNPQPMRQIVEGTATRLEDLETAFTKHVTEP